MRKPVVGASVKAQSHGLIIHCHGGGFVAQSSASHQVRQECVCVSLSVCLSVLLCASLTARSDMTWSGTDHCPPS